ncbi:MAG: hypothetical protein JXO48_12635, partial [Deltaproteobacteria bacterium]|nr:hypothetical protein [Deltaproteobacteria bacterium]
PYPSNRSYIVVELEPTVTAALAVGAQEDDICVFVDPEDMDGFAIGDELAIGDLEEDYELISFDVTRGLFSIDDGLDLDVEEGAAVSWIGPMQRGYESVETEMYEDSMYFADHIIVANPDNLDFGSCTGSVRITAPEETEVEDAYYNGEGCGFVVYALELDVDLSMAYASGTPVEGYNYNFAGAYNTVVVSGPYTAGVTEIEVDNASGLEAGDGILFDEGGMPVFAVIESIDGNVLTLTAGLSADVASGVTAEEATFISTEMVTGYPFVLVKNMIGVKPNSTVTFDDGVETDSATVVGALSDGSGAGYLVIDDITSNSEGNPYNFDADTTVVTIGSSRDADVLQVKVLDRSGNPSCAWFDEVGFDEDGDWDIF